jgi:hypothetical protein
MMVVNNVCSARELPEDDPEAIAHRLCHSETKAVLDSAELPR